MGEEMEVEEEEEEEDEWWKQKLEPKIKLGQTLTDKSGGFWQHRKRGRCRLREVLLRCKERTKYGNPLRTTSTSVGILEIGRRGR